MNGTVNKFWVAGDKLMFVMHLRQPGFTYSTHGPFTKTNKEYKNLQKLEIHDIFIETN